MKTNKHKMIALLTIDNKVMKRNQDIMMGINRLKKTWK